MQKDLCGSPFLIFLKSRRMRADSCPFVLWDRTYEKSSKNHNWKNFQMPHVTDIWMANVYWLVWVSLKNPAEPRACRAIQGALTAPWGTQQYLGASHPSLCMEKGFFQNHPNDSTLMNLGGASKPVLIWGTWVNLCLVTNCCSLAMSYMVQILLGPQLKQKVLLLLFSLCSSNSLTYWWLSFGHPAVLSVDTLQLL